MDRPLAWDDPATVRRWRKLRRTGRIALAISLVLFAVISIVLGRQDDHRDWLLRNGVAATGTVLKEPPTTLRCRQVAVPIRFATTRRIVVAPFFVDSCEGGGLHRGDTVHVDFDPRHPTDMVVNGQVNEHPLPTFLTLLGIVLMGFCFGGWLLRARTLHDARRVLQRHPWKPGTISAVPFRSAFSQGRRLVRFVEGGDGTDAALITSFLGRNAVPESGSIDIAGDHSATCVLRKPSADVFVLARAPRTRWTKRRIDRQR